MDLIPKTRDEVYRQLDLISYLYSKFTLDYSVTELILLMYLFIAYIPHLKLPLNPNMAHERAETVSLKHHFQHEQATKAILTTA